MGITDELRCMEAYDGMVHVGHNTLIAIADRIDAEHEAQVADAFETRNSDENLEADGWVRLPVDADGVPIHVGDLMDDGKKVARIVLTDGEWEPYVLLYDKPNVLREYFCNEISHYHPPTVEDVLREMAGRFAEADFNWNSDLENVIAEYAAKLRLSGEDE